MTMLFRKTMHVVCTVLLLTQSVLIPMDIANAEVTNEIEDIEQAVGPIAKDEIDCLEENMIAPLFSFSKVSMQGIVGESIDVAFFSDQEASEARIVLPSGAEIVKDQLPDGFSVIQLNEEDWIIKSDQMKTEFSLPLIFGKSGVYELFLNDQRDTLKIVISEDLFEEELSDSLNKDEINETQNTYIKNSSDVTNLLENSNFSFNLGHETTIPSWELASSTTPVNFLNRNLTISLQSNENGLNQLSDSSFLIGGGNNLQVNRITGSRTLIVTQTIPVTPGHTYELQVDASGSILPCNLILTLYNGRGVVAGPNGIHSPFYRLTPTRDTYTLRFTANTTNLSVGIRVDGSIATLHKASLTPVAYSLNLEASPPVGGIVETSVDSLIQGQEATILATANPGYRFVRWQTVAETNAIVEDSKSEITKFTMGNSDTTLQAIFEEIKGNVHVNYVDTEGNKLVDSKELTGIVGERYETQALEIENYSLVGLPDNTQGIFTEEDITVTYIYEVKKVHPLDPLNPEVEVNPENKPILPENQGFLSIDFVSSFKFGSQAISVKDQTYFAQPQLLLNKDGTVNPSEKRPNYIQVSDRRPENNRNGWQLAFTQKEQFKGKDNQELMGASLSIMNQQVVTHQGGTAPSVQLLQPLTLVPGNKRTLLHAEQNEGAGTWIYRFGDLETAAESIALNVPKGTMPKATTYQTTFIWELISVPGN